MPFYPYMIEYWEQVEEEPYESLKLTVDAQNEEDAKERFLAMKRKHVYFIVHEPFLED